MDAQGQRQLDFRPRRRKPGFEGVKQNQAERILELLRERSGEWVPLPAILALGVAQYNARIGELRAAGHNIRNKTQWSGSERHSWFGLNVPEGK